MGKQREMSRDPVFAAKLRGYKPARSVYWSNWNACAECDFLFRNCNRYDQCPRCESYDTYKPFAVGVNWAEIDRRREQYQAERSGRTPHQVGGGGSKGRAAQQDGEDEPVLRRPINLAQYRLAKQKMLTRFA